MSKLLIDRAVVEQALEALHPTSCGNWTPTIALNAEAAIHVLHAALEQPQVEQEPVAWKYHYTDSDGDLNIWSSLRDPKKIHAHELDRLSAVAPLYTHPQPPRQQPQVEQEPVAVVTGYYGGFPTIRPLEPAKALPYGMALYAHPQPPRQPLTDDEINTIWRNSTHMTIVEVVRAIEAAHGIKEQK